LSDWESSPKLVGEHPAEVDDVVLSPDGRLLATSDLAGQVRLWSLDSESKEPERIFDGSGVWYLAFDNSGDRLAAYGAPDGHPTVRLWNLKSPIDAEPTVLKREDDLAYLINGAAFDRSGQWLATGHARSAAVWPVGSRLPVTLTGHERRVCSVAFTPDGKQLVSASSDGTVRVYTLESGGPSRVLLDENLQFPALVMDPAGRFIAVTGRSSVFVVPLDGGAPRELEGFSSEARYLMIALDSEGRFVAATPQSGQGVDNVIRIWDLESGESRVLGPPESTGDGVEGEFSGLDFLPDGRLLSSGNTGLNLWDPEEGHVEVLSTVQGWSVVVSRDGRFVLRSEASDSGDRLVRFDMENGVSQVLSSHGNEVLYPAFDPSGRLALSTGMDGMVRVGRGTGEEPHLLFAHEGPVRSAAVSPDGQWIASAGEDGKIRLWPMPDVNEPPLHTLPHEDILTRLRAFTNVRIVEDEATSTGYRIDYAPFPGWEKVPEW
jgi:WD40 repeat protein